MQGRWTAILGAGAITMVSACFPEAPTMSDVDVERSTTDRYAVIALSAERAVGRDDASVDVRAHFVEARDVSAAAALAAFDLAPLEARCDVRAQRPTTAGAGAHVELLDVGNLHVYGSGESVQLEPMAVPAQLQQLAGVVYGTDDGAPTPTYGADEPFLVWVEGASGDGFSVGLRAPERVAVHAVNGRSPGSAEALHVDLDEGLFIELESAAPSVDVELRAGLAPHVVTYRCSHPGDQPIAVDAAVLASLRAAGEPIELTLSAWSLEPFPEGAPIDGELRFAFVDTLELVTERAAR